MVANILICLVHQTNYLLDQLIRELEKAFCGRGRPTRTHDASPIGGAGETPQSLNSVGGSETTAPRKVVLATMART
jgi:hypothetical protein